MAGHDGAYSEMQKFEVYDEMQSHIDALKVLGVSLRYAERKMQLKWGSDPDSKPMPVNVLHVVGFPRGKEPEQFATPQSGGDERQGSDLSAFRSIYTGELP